MRTLGNITDLNLLFDLSPDLLGLFDLNCHFLKVNNALIRTLGYGENELLSRNFLDFIHPDDRKDTLKQIELLGKNETVFLFINRYRCADGTYKWLSWNANRLPDCTYYASARDVTEYKIAQIKLEKAVSDNQKIFDNSMDLLCTINAEGQFIKTSKAIESILGYRENELVGRNSFSIVHPEDLMLMLNLEIHIKAGNQVTNFEGRILHRSGKYVPVIWSATWLVQDQVIFAIVRDATEREKQKEQIKLREHRLNALIESGDDIIIILDPEGIYKFVSPSVKRILNTDPEFYLGKNTFDFIHPEDLPWLGAAFGSVLQTEDPVYIAPFRFLVTSGKWVWIETIATNRLNDPAIQGIVINSKDVTKKLKDEKEKQLAAESLKLSNERYQLASEATKDVIWDWDLEKNEMSRNQCFQKLFGYSFSAVHADHLNWETYIHPQDKTSVLQSIRSALSDPDQKFWRQEYRYLKADGSVIFIIDQGYIIRNEDRKAIRMVGAMQNVTELKEKEFRILKQVQQLQEIAQINSHETRRPVATILGLMEIFDDSCPNSPENREWFKNLKKTTQELDDVIKRINNKAIV